MPAELIMFFDTETTGLFQRHLPHDHRTQPNLVQLGILLTTDMGREVSSASLIVNPEGYEIPEGAARVHGITTEIAKACGVPLATVGSVFSNIRARAGELVAFNLDFDEAIMRTAFSRLGRQPAHPGPDKRTCCMRLAAPIVGLPGTDRMRSAGRSGPKPPSLHEAHRSLIGSDFADAHDALADARACARVFFKLKELANAKEESPVEDIPFDP